jgi:predicted AlkP superfamily pyrophosphatase or phosphodiesterase
MTKFLWPLIICLSFVAACGSESDGDAPYLILISIDGFGWNVQDANDTPALDRVAASGIRAEAMRPVYPTMTFPNHYSIATGLYPYQHGIVDNDFPNADRTAWYHFRDRDAVEDGSWYGGEPIWVSAEKNGITSAAFFFVGTEATISGFSPTYWRTFDATIPGEARVRQVLDWLALPDDERPHMITLYFEDVDAAGHDFGPGTPEFREAVTRVDGVMTQLLDGIDNLEIRDDVHIIIVSDHGLIPYQTADDAFVISDHVDLVGLTVIDHGSYVSIYMDSYDEERAQRIRDAVNDHWEYGRAYLRNESPEHWRVTDDLRFADIAMIADPAYRVISNRDRPLRVNGGNHGWDPSVDDMRGIFLASGSQLPSGITVGEISSVDVYPLMMGILGLPVAENVDIEGNILLPLLAQPEKHVLN